MNLPVIIEPVVFTDNDVEHLAWSEMVHEQFMAQLEKELALGLPFNADGIAVCIMCRSPLNSDGNCNFCGQRADMPLPSQFFVAKF